MPAFDKLEAEKPEGGLCEWSESGPAEAEELAVIRACYLSAKTGARFYLVHQSSAAGVKAAKANRPATVFVETTSPYLSLTKNCDAGLLAKMLPVIKEESDREALWDAVKDGTIDSIGTDNVSLTKEVKGVERGMLGALAGYPVLQTHLTVLLHEGVNKRGVALERIVEVTSRNPAQIFGVYPQEGHHRRGHRRRSGGGGSGERRRGAGVQHVLLRRFLALRRSDHEGLAGGHHQERPGGGGEQQDPRGARLRQVHPAD